jgi:hypothetical protein
MLLSVHNAIISKPADGGAGQPMPLHTDQWWMPQPQRRPQPPRIRAGSVDRAKAHTPGWSAEPGSEFIAPPVAAQCFWPRPWGFGAPENVSGAPAIFSICIHSNNNISAIVVRIFAIQNISGPQMTFFGARPSASRA